MVNMFPLEEGEKITAILPVKQFDDGHFIFMATAQGTVKKTPLSAFANPRGKGIIAAELDEGDFLIGVAITDGKHDVMLFSDAGKAVRFEEDDVRPTGRVTRGVRGMMLEDGQRVISMLVAENESQTVLTATENGFGKRTPISEYTRHGRGTKGMIAIHTGDRNGQPGRRGAGRGEGRGDAGFERRRGHPHEGGADSRTGALDPGRDPDQPRRGHAARRHREGAGVRRGQQRQQWQWRGEEPY